MKTNIENLNDNNNKEKVITEYSNTDSIVDK